jgi:Cellulose biosynthesis protein BcsS
MRALVTGLLAAILVAECGWADESVSPNTTPAPARFMFLSGADLWPNGAFAHSAIVWSPYGLDQSGFTAKVLAGYGTYRYLAGGPGGVEVTGRQYLGSLMPGWRFKFDHFEITVFGGLDFQDHLLTPDDPASTVRGTMYGGRAAADLWYEPWSSVMLETNASVSSIGPSYWTRAAAGYRLLDMIWLGPEALALGDMSYQQYRVGVHATGLKTKWFEWSMGAGWATDSDQRTGYYGRLGILLRR